MVEFLPRKQARSSRFPSKVAAARNERSWRRVVVVGLAAVLLGGLATSSPAAAAVTPAVAVAVGWAGTIVRSADGGQTWTSVTAPTTSNLQDVATDHVGTWVAVGGPAGAAVRSTTNGTSWLPVAIGVTSRMFGVATDRAGTWVMVGFGDMRRSTDNGATWNAVSLPAAARGWFFDVRTDGQGTWVAVGRGVLARSTDNGATWTALASPPPLPNLEAVAAGLPGEWVAVGSASLSVATNECHSTDSAATWTCITVGSPADLRDIDGSTSTGYAATGVAGAIFSSTSGAGIWGDARAFVPTYPVTNVRGIAHDSSSWVVVGVGGTISWSADSATWASKSSGTSTVLESVAIVG